MTDATNDDIHIALMRGINLGGKNKVPMKDLAAMFAEAGCHDVQTYIQSGNVVFRAAPSVARKVAGAIERAIADRWSLRVPLVTRSAAELRHAAENNPFLKAGADPNTLHVAFLAATPSAAKVETLDAERSPGDRFAVVGRDIYLLLPNGVARTKLTNDYFDRKLGTTSTVRNWRTVLKLVEMVGG